jgi:hypothetical protein
LPEKEEQKYTAAMVFVNKAPQEEAREIHDAVANASTRRDSRWLDGTDHDGEEVVSGKFMNSSFD